MSRSGETRFRLLNLKQRVVDSVPNVSWQHKMSSRGRQNFSNASDSAPRQSHHSSNPYPSPCQSSYQNCKKRLPRQSNMVDGRFIPQPCKRYVPGLLKAPPDPWSSGWYPIYGLCIVIVGPTGPIQFSAIPLQKHVYAVNVRLRHVQKRIQITPLNLQPAIKTKQQLVTVGLGHSKHRAAFWQLIHWCSEFCSPNVSSISRP